MTKIVVSRVINRPAIQLKRKSSIVTAVSQSSISVNDLIDIEAKDPEDKEVMIYNQEKNKYEIRKISGEDIDGPLEGGEF